MSSRPPGQHPVSMQDYIDWPIPLLAEEYNKLHARVSDETQESPLSVREHLVRLALGKALATKVKRTEHVDEALMAGASVDDIAGALLLSPEDVRANYRDWLATRADQYENPPEWWTKIKPDVPLGLAPEEVAERERLVAEPSDQ